MEDVVIVSAARTAVGKFGGSIAKVSAPDLGATVIRALLARSGVSPELINEEAAKMMGHIWKTPMTSSCADRYH